jgi:hypothetical protein
MNERIRELIKTKSTILFPGTDTVDCEITDIEKFAELIVRECFDVVIADGRFHDAKGVIRAGKGVAMEHFGVEE